MQNGGDDGHALRLPKTERRRLAGADELPTSSVECTRSQPREAIESTHTRSETLMASEAKESREKAETALAKMAHNRCPAFQMITAAARHVAGQDVNALIKNE